MVPLVDKAKQSNGEASRQQCDQSVIMSYSLQYTWLVLAERNVSHIVCLIFFPGKRYPVFDWKSFVMIWQARFSSLQKDSSCHLKVRTVMS
jgi:hypothetical protein